MALWGEVELLCRAVSEAGREAADQVLSRAKAEARRIRSQMKEQTLREIQHAEQSRKSELHAAAGHIVDAAEVEARKRMMTFQEETTRELFTTLEEHLNGLRSHPDYAAFLLLSVREGLDLLPGNEFVVTLHPGDAETMRDGIEAIAQQRSCRISLQADQRVRCGALIYTGDRRLLYDNTLSARLKRHADTVRREIWRAIFANEPSTT